MAELEAEFTFDKEVGTGLSQSTTADATPRLTTILALAAAEGDAERIVTAAAAAIAKAKRY